VLKTQILYPCQKVKETTSLKFLGFYSSSDTARDGILQWGTDEIIFFYDRLDPVNGMLN